MSYVYVYKDLISLSLSYEVIFNKDLKAFKKGKLA